MKEFVRITSKENQLIKMVSTLQNSAKLRRENNQFVLEGLRLCRDAVLNNYKVLTLICSDTAYEKLNEEIEQLANCSDKVFIVPDSLFKKMSDTVSPQGVLCLCKLPDFSDIKVLNDGKYIALEHLADPSNVGAISRTAEALGIDGIFLSKDSCDPYSSKALRASMGALLRIPIILCDDLIKTLKSFNFTIYGTVVDKTAKNITEIKFNDGSAVIIGNEANGITEETKSSCDSLITIPMSGKAESLNAATAAAITMWEMCK